MTRHLVVDVSGHGFGHLAQTAPVLNRLAQRLPGLRLTVRTALPEAVVARRLRTPFRYQAAALDFGMVMADAVTVDVPASLAAYRRFHARWPERTAREAAILRSLAPDLLLANAPYLRLAAAFEAGVPGVAMCSLNWAEILGGYCPDDGEAAQLCQTMRTAYNQAEVFFQLTPFLPMSGLAAARPTGPVGETAASVRPALQAHLGLPATARLALLSMGGVAHRLPVEAWPTDARWHYIVPAEWGVRGPHFIDLEALPWDFRQVLASSDALITKPGYGAFVESALCGTPVLYHERPDWPEQPWLVAWLAAHGRVRAAPASAFARGDLPARLDALVAQPAPPPPTASGIDEVVSALLARLG